MKSISPSRVCLVAVVFLASLPPVVAQTAPAIRESKLPPQKVSTDNASYVARCVEELDLAACVHAEKLPLSAKEKSQVLTYKQAPSFSVRTKHLSTRQSASTRKTPSPISSAPGAGLQIPKRRSIPTERRLSLRRNGSVITLKWRSWRTASRAASPATKG